MRLSLSINILKSNKGQAMYLVIGAISLVSIVTLFSMSNNNRSAQLISSAKLELVIEQVRQKLMATLMTPQAWQKIQLGNPSAFNQPGGIVVNPQLLDIYLPNSDVGAFYPSTHTNAGFDPSGNPCQDFSLEGNNACPIRFEVYLLSRNLINGNWVDTIRFRLKYRPTSSEVTFNESKDRYNFDFIRNFNAESVEAVCIAIGGSYSSANNHCSVNFSLEANCNSSTVLAGNFQTPCKPVNLSFQCPPNQAMRGLSGTGTPLCQSI